jgi:hypothetical protein
MTELSESEQLAHLQARMAADSAAAFPSLGQIFAFLQESEAQMLVLIQYICNPSKIPQVPTQGDVEFGFVLYWIHNPPAEVTAFLCDHPLLKFVYELLAGAAPATRITTDQYNQLISDLGDYGLPWTDGTLYGTYYKYQQLDPYWMLAALNYAVNLLDPDLVHELPDNQTASVTLTRKDGDTSCDPVIGIVGDWGTGYFPDEAPGVNCPAQRVMDQITNPQLSPAIDYLIHLGDVYYAGTDLRPLPGEEQDNFYGLWPDQGAGRNWTLNSNHEMYGAASGYFDVTLQKGGLFDAQNGMSYFAMTYGPWLVLGLDSAYYSDAANGMSFYMEGGIGTEWLPQQIGWMAQFQKHQGPIMVMTHHAGADNDGGQTSLLYSQVLAALGRPPTLWYWGHVHNAIVYDTLTDATAVPPTVYPTLGRCCGHGAIPFGNAWGLQDASGNNLPNIVYYAHTPDPDLPDTGGSDPCNPRVRNGYALVTLQQDGGFTEAFYETGDSTPVWQKSWTAAELAALQGQ